ncbi:MAG: GNAT family N-acetyltransferase [Hyphomicrobiales bacterium]
MLNTRDITLNDAELICSHRHAMFEASSKPRDRELAQMATPFHDWLLPQLSSGKYFGFVTEIETTPVASIGLMTIDWPPHPLHPTSDRRGYVLNMYVEPEFRGRGIARNLLKLSEVAFSERNIQYAVLHSTSKGQSFYENNGWSSTPEMAKIIRPAEIQNQT